MENDDFASWFARLQGGDQLAAKALLDEYFEKLVRLARAKLGELPRRAADEEDVALSAMNSFLRGAAQGRFARLGDADELWKLLATIASRKVCNQRDRHLAQKRGGGKVSGESAIVWPDRAPGIQGAKAPEPSPAMAAEMADTCQRALELLGDERTRQIALDKLAGFTMREIAERRSVSEQTVFRKLNLIRDRWAQAFDMCDATTASEEGSST
jgi:DNA-directed RNA polymerase specialized sigma24 family protein